MVAENTAELLTREGLITLAEATRMFAQRPSTSTLWRWHRSGINGATLEVVRCGRRFYTSRPAVVRFIAAQDAPRAASPEKPASREREESIERARVGLEKRRHQMIDPKPLPPEVQHALHLLMLRFPAWTDTFPVGRRPDAATLSARMTIITDAFANAYRLGLLTLECFETALMKPYPAGIYFLCDRCEAIEGLRENALEWWQCGEQPPGFVGEHENE